MCQSTVPMAYFRKVPFTFTNISANALYKGISANPHPEFAFTYLSPIFHHERVKVR